MTTSGGSAHESKKYAKMKTGNKQCLFDTPHTVNVNKEMLSEYLDHKNNCVCPIIAKSKKCLSSYNCHFVKNYLYNIKRLHVNVQCVCIVKAKSNCCIISCVRS